MSAISHWLVLSLLYLQPTMGFGYVPLAYVYEGPGSCVEGCSEAAANIAKRAGLKVKRIKPHEITKAVVAQADIWIQPGGYAPDVSSVLGEDGRKILRDAVDDGMAYVGFCAGAFLADKLIDHHPDVPGLGIIPVDTDDYPVDSGDHGISLPIQWGGKWRDLFFNGGAFFDVKTNHLSEVDVLARFEDGMAATISTFYGDGAVVVTGAHPEAFSEWKKDAKLPNPEKVDWDLAEEMVELALAARR